MTQTFAIQLYRGLLAAFTILVLVVTSYLSLIGFVYAIDRSTDLHSRAEGLLFLLPGVAMLLFLCGLLPFVHRRSLLALGLVASLVLLAPAIACMRSGFLGADGRSLSATSSPASGEY